MKKKEKISTAKSPDTVKKRKKSEKKINDREEHASIKDGKKLPYKIGLLIAASLIALITFAVFSSALTADFVMWDDNWLIYQNPKLGILNLQNLWSILTDETASSSFYTPLGGLRLLIIYTFCGLNPFGYHLYTLLFHCVDAVLLFFIVRKLVIISLENQRPSEIPQLRIDIIAALTALLWSLHPLRVEPVASASGGVHVQAAFFMFLSLLGYFRYSKDKTRYFHWLIISAVCYGASTLSLPITLTFPAVLVVLDVYPLKRIVVVNGWWKSQEVRRAILDKIPFIAIALMVFVANVAVSAQKPGHSYHVSLANFGLIDRIMQSMYALSYYIWRPFYPVDLAPVYTTLLSFDPLSMQFILSAFSMIAVSIVLFIFRKRWPIGLAIFLTYIILLIPAMGFFEHPYYPVDRYSLAPSICLSILIAFGLISLIKNKYFSVISISILLVIISVLSLLSLNQVKFWNNSESLFTHMIRTLGNDPYKQDIYWRLGKYLSENGKKKEAIINFEKTLEINPNHPIANYYLAEREYNNGNLIKAIYHFQNILIVNPNNFKVHYRLSQLFDKLNKKKEAAYYFERAVNLQRAMLNAQNETSRP